MELVLTMSIFGGKFDFPASFSSGKLENVWIKA